MATSKIIPNVQVVHSRFDGSRTLQTNANTYYNLFENLPAGLWIIFMTHYCPSGEVVICYGNSYDNSIVETGASGQSGAGIINLTNATTIQMYVTNATTISRFKAEAVRLA